MESKRVLVLMADGVEEMELVAVADCLRRAGCEVSLVAMDREVVAGGHGIRIGADAVGLASARGPWDLVVLPGGGGCVERLLKDEPLRAFLRERVAQGGLTGAICAAPLVLAKAGLLAGRNATGYQSTRDDLAAAGALLARPEVQVVEDGNLVTSQGPGTAVAFALTLVQRLHGAAVADRVAAEIHAARPGR